MAVALERVLQQLVRSLPLSTLTLEILWMSERDVKDLGVKNGAHRAILVSSLIVLKRKYDKGSRIKSGGTLLSSRFRSSSSLTQAKEK
ncbi:hypothetical protein MRX96_049391 [Rhipicephalus microplus]